MGCELRATSLFSAAERSSSVGSGQLTVRSWQLKCARMLKDRSREDLRG